MTVHGELEVVPTATASEAEQAVKDFTEAYNKADKAYDPALDAGRVTGPLGAVNQAGLKARSVTSPNGNPQHQPLVLTDTTYLIPKKAGWPRWFVANADSNRDTDSGAADTRWLLVFVKNGSQQLWEVAYLSILTPGQIPAFKKGPDGFVEPADPASTTLALAPRNLSEAYASYLGNGKPEQFAPGPHTNGWREERVKGARRAGLATQYVDQALDTGDFAPLGLTTEDGGALVFFAIRFHERQTAAPGYRPKVSADVKALMTGEVKNTVTKEWVASQTVVVKPAGQERDGVTVLGRLQGVVSAQGS